MLRVLSFNFESCNPFPSFLAPLAKDKQCLNQHNFPVIQTPLLDLLIVDELIDVMEAYTGEEEMVVNHIEYHLLFQVAPKY